jgi:hypothetical protein
MYKGKGVGLELFVLAQDGAAAADAAHDWAAAEEAYHVGVTVVEASGRLAARALARALLQRCSPAVPAAVTLHFAAPLIGDLRCLQLVANSQVLDLSRSVELRAVCACHGALLGGAGAGVCAVTGAALPVGGAVSDGRVVQVGPHAAGTLHLKSPLSLAVGGAGGAAPARHLQPRVRLAEVPSGLLGGPPTTLRAAGAGAAAGEGVKVLMEGGLVDLTPGQLLAVLAQALRGAREGLLCSGPSTLDGGAAPGLFRSASHPPTPPPGGQRWPAPAAASAPPCPSAWPCTAASTPATAGPENVRCCAAGRSTCWLPQRALTASPCCPR